MRNKQNDTRLDRTFQPPSVLITLDAFQKIFAFARACSVEINGFGTVMQKGNSLIIDDVFILSQRATLHSVETNPEAIHEMLFESIKRGVDPQINLQWHSHVDMDTYCSHTDLRTVENYRGDYMINLVVNKFGEHHCRLDVYKPLRIGFTTTMRVIVPIANKLLVKCKEEVKEKVKIIRDPDDNLASRILGKVLQPKDNDCSDVPIAVEGSLENKHGLS